MEKDIYDIGIEWLREHPNKIVRAWQLEPYSVPVEASVLFRYAWSNRLCGCLTQVADGHLAALVEELLVVDGFEPIRQAILADDLPRKPDQIGVEHLELFAEWQRYLDALLPDANRGLRGALEEKYDGNVPIKKPSASFLARHPGLKPVETRDA